METTPMQQDRGESTENAASDAAAAPAAPAQAPGSRLPEASTPLDSEEADGQEQEDVRGVRKALRDTKAWATRLIQENIALKRALESSPAGGETADCKGALAAEQLARTRRALERHEEFGPLLELVETMVGQAALYEREMAHQALLQAVLADHPDALDLRRDDEFLSWVDHQPPVVSSASTTPSTPPT